MVLVGVGGVSVWLKPSSSPHLPPAPPHPSIPRTHSRCVFFRSASNSVQQQPKSSEMASEIPFFHSCLTQSAPPDVALNHDESAAPEEDALARPQTGRHLRRPFVDGGNARELQPFGMRMALNDICERRARRPTIATQ